MKITIQQALEKMTFEELKKEYMNTFQKDFLWKYNTSTKTCLQLFGNKKESSDWSRAYRLRKPKEEKKIIKEIDRSFVNDRKFEIIGEFREMSYIKWVFLSKNSGYTIQH